MKNYITRLLTLLLLSSFVIYFVACDDEDDGPQLTGESQTYELSSVSNPAISGTVTFAKRSDSKTVITVNLNGTQSGGDHPAHIHANTAAEGGGIVLDLTNVDGATGESETVVDALNDDTPLTYEQLLEFDGYVNVHESSANLGTLIAQGDIGQNALTDDTETYTLSSVSNPAISGTATFTRRQNDETQVIVQLTGTSEGGDHPSHIHANSAAAGGGIVIDLSNVSGATGIGKTNVTRTNDGTTLTYADLIDFDGYINVHMSADNLGTLIAQGDIGQNQLTGETKVYALNELGDSGVSGTATFARRKNNTTLVTISLDGTQAGDTHPSHIHANDAATGGPIVLDFKSIDGGTGLSVNQIAAMKDGTPITYAELLEFDGYINVHLSPTQLGTLIAQGNIGSNAE